MKNFPSSNSVIATKLLKEFFIPFNLSSDSLYKTYEEIAQKYIAVMPKDALAVMPDIDFTENDFNFPEELTVEYKYEIILGVTNLWHTILNVRDGCTPLFLNFAGLERQTCPPLEVFRYKGFSELNITLSTNGYSLLFT